VSKSCRTHDHILLSQLRLPQPGGPGPCIYIPQEQGGPVIPPSNGFPFVASYDSQGCGGGILTRLHTNKERSAVSIEACKLYCTFTTHSSHPRRVERTQPHLPATKRQGCQVYTTAVILGSHDPKVKSTGHYLLIGLPSADFRKKFPHQNSANTPCLRHLSCTSSP
jgi:hypothetical protein